MMKTEIPVKILHKCLFRAFASFYFFPVCNAPSVFQVHGIRYPTGGNYFVPYREFRPSERGWLDSYEDINTPYIPRTTFPSALLKNTVQCLAAWSMVKELSFHGSFSLGLFFRDSQREHRFWSLSSDANKFILGFGLVLAHFTGLLRGFKVVTWRRQFSNLLHSMPAKAFLTYELIGVLHLEKKNLYSEMFSFLIACHSAMAARVCLLASGF